MIYWEERQNAYFIHANASKNETIKNRVEGNVSKKFLFRKFKWYIRRKMKNVLGNGFWPKYFAYIIQLTLTAAQDGWYYYSHFKRKVHFRGTWRCPGSSVRDHTQIQTLRSLSAKFQKKEMGLVPVHGEMTLIFVPEACLSLEPTKGYIQGLSQMS